MCFGKLVLVVYIDLFLGESDSNGFQKIESVKHSSVSGEPIQMNMKVQIIAFAHCYHTTLYPP